MGYTEQQWQDGTTGAPYGPISAARLTHMEDGIAAATGSAGPFTIKVSYVGTPGASPFYAAFDMAGNVITARTSSGITESSVVPGLFTYDQLISLDQIIIQWDEGDVNGPDRPPATEIIATKHLASLPAAPTGVTAAAGDARATVSFTAPDNGGSAILSYTVTSSPGGKVQSGVASPLVVTGLTNGTAYTFTVTATTLIGTGPASAASNSVTPAGVTHVPGVPTSVVATAGNAQATVTFTAPASNGGSAITGYTVTAVDETTTGNGGQTPSGSGSPITVTGLTNGDVYHFTVHATNVIGSGAESAASNSVTPVGSGTAKAVFSYTVGPSSLINLDAAGSVGTLKWTVDGVDAVSTATTVTFGPLTVGTHTIKLTATSGGSVSSQQTIAVPWVGWPFHSESDPCNGGGTNGTWGLPLQTVIVSGKSKLVGAHSTTLLPQWSDLDPYGAWKTKDVLNMAEGFPGAGDGVSRYTTVSSTEVQILTKMPDRPGDAGGYRGALDWTSNYGNLNNSPVDFGPGYEFQANSAFGRIDATGMAPGDGTSTLVRFYRIGIKIPGTNPGGPSDTNTYPPGFTNTGLMYQNNAFEIHGNIGGSSPMAFGTDGPGAQVGWVFEQVQGGAQIGPQHKFDFANIQYDAWYDYVLEIIWNLDPTIGYVRVYRDYGDGAGYVLIPLARCPAGTKGKSPDTTPSSSPDYGKFFAATQQTDATNNIVKMSFDLQNYRNKVNLDAFWQTYGVPYPDVKINWRKVAIGPTLASVANL